MDNLKLYCRSCGRQFHAEYSNKGQLQSSQLSQHLLSTKGMICKALYDHENMTKVINTRSGLKTTFDFSTSTTKNKLSEIYKNENKIKEEKQTTAMKRKLGFVDMGNEASNTVGKISKRQSNNDNVSSKQDQEKEKVNAVLNNKVLFDATVPKISRDNFDNLSFFTSQITKGMLSDDDMESIQSEEGTEEEKTNIESKNDIESDMLVKWRCERQSENILPMSPELQAEVSLMNLMTQHKMPLSAFHSIMTWAKNSTINPSTPVRKRQTVINDIKKHMNMKTSSEFKPHLIIWLPDNYPTTIYIRSFTDTLYSLLSNKKLMVQENISMPREDSPFLSADFLNREEKSEYVTELHHGEWWINSWKDICQIDDNSIEILVPVILYMDGITTDNNGRLNLTPLNMTLGIFNTETRTRPEAWGTIYYHPDHETESIYQSRKPTSYESLLNLHRGLNAALESFHQTTSNGPLDWDWFPYAGKIWKVKMRFAIAFVVGDTELHDKLCGKYGVRNDKVERLCRHCDCPNEYTVDPKVCMIYVVHIL